MKRILVLVLMLAGPASAQSFVTERLAGEALFGGATLVDPPEGEPRGTHAYLTVTGPAARRIFDAMPGPARPDACEPSRRSKRAGQVTCSVGRRAQEAQCDFALLIARGELTGGRPC
ncbi:hypothetical protein [Roseococcus sp. YIM B11640]|uniref:hypothetical protein n=1 Tax=Roseococcus sp. YIM B11640 TaxID=3133973 RepID=UPI003C79B837